MLGMKALIDGALYKLDEAERKAIHGLANCRTKDEMRKDIAEMARLINEVEKMMKYNFEEDKQ